MLSNEPNDAGKIDQAFSNLVLSLKEAGFEPCEIFFVGMSNLVEFSFGEARNPYIVVSASLNAILKQIEKRIPRFDTDLDNDGVVH